MRLPILGRTRDLRPRTAAQVAGLVDRPQAPPADELRRQASRCRALLERSVIGFYLPAAVDTQHGGYLQDADERGVFRVAPERFLSLQARQMWLFSTLVAESVGPPETALPAARAGYDMLRRFRDDAHGGYHSKVSVDGQPIESRKELCLLSFALFALAAYHRASGEIRALDEAKQLFGELEAHAHDSRYGGYLELFDADWTPVQDQQVRSYWAWGGTKTQNGHLHMLESLTELHRVWPDELVVQRLGELVSILLVCVKHPSLNCTVTRWSPDWRMLRTPPEPRASYGHDLEGVWLVLEAARTLGWQDHALRGWAEGTTTYSLGYGYDPKHGGFYTEGPFGGRATDRRKEWWAQAEALVTMLELYRLTSDPGYYGVFAATLDFIEEHQVAPVGGWWSLLREDGSRVPKATLGSSFQDGYHSGRALMRCERLLDELAGTAYSTT